MNTGQLYIRLDIRHATALQAGSTRAGYITVPVTTSLLDLLTGEERAGLADYTTTDAVDDGRYDRRLTADTAEPEQIALALRAEIKRQQEEREEQEREAQQRADEGREHAAWALQQPLEVWVESIRGYTRALGPEPEGYYGSHDDAYRTAYSAVEGVAERQQEARAEIKRQQEERKALAKAAREEQERRKAQQQEQEEQERLAWIVAHGSGRLMRLAAEHIEHRAVYLDERLAAERPGWRWSDRVVGSDSEPRNPPVEALDLLDAARATLPEEEGSRLVYWVVAVDDLDLDEYGYCEEDDPRLWRGYAVVSRFMGREIVFGGPEDE